MLHLVVLSLLDAPATRAQDDSRPVNGELADGSAACGGTLTLAGSLDLHA